MGIEWRAPASPSTPLASVHSLRPNTAPQPTLQRARNVAFDLRTLAPSRLEARVLRARRAALYEALIVLGWKP